MSDIASSTVSANSAAEFGRMNKRSLDFIFDAQRAFLDEMILINNTAFEHTCGEVGIATELMSKLAEAHSVKTIMDVCEECRKHQVDVLRRDNDRLFQYGQRFLDRASGFLTNAVPPKLPS